MANFDSGTYKLTPTLIKQLPKITEMTEGEYKGNIAIKAGVNLIPGRVLKWLKVGDTLKISPTLDLTVSPTLVHHLIPKTIDSQLYFKRLKARDFEAN